MVVRRAVFENADLPQELTVFRSAAVRGWITLETFLSTYDYDLRLQVLVEMN